MGVSKATTKKEALKEFKGLKKFTILVNNKNHKKGDEVELTFELYSIFKKLKLV
jgi:hypothetical protein